MSQIKLADVAAAAGVHVGTASRALNPAKRSTVNVKTAQRILDAANRLGYHVDHAARALRTQRTGSVGVLIPDLTNPLFPPIIRGIEDTLEKAGFFALVANTDNEPERESRLFAEMRSRRVEGFITASSRMREMAEQAGSDLPIVEINRVDAHHAFPAVVADDRLAMDDVAVHLRSLGHQRIAFIAGPSDTSTGVSRRGSLERAARQYDLHLDDTRIRVADRYSLDEGARCMRELLRAGRDFTAVVAGNDLLAMGALDVLRENRIDCPRQMSLVGFDDLAFVDRIHPALTTVHVPKYDMGVKAAELLLASLDGDRDIVTATLNTRLIVRKSTDIARSL